MRKTLLRCKQWNNKLNYCSSNDWTRTWSYSAKLYNGRNTKFSEALRCKVKFVDICPKHLDWFWKSQEKITKDTKQFFLFRKWKISIRQYEFIEYCTGKNMLLGCRTISWFLLSRQCSHWFKGQYWEFFEPAQKSYLLAKAEH